MLQSSESIDELRMAFRNGDRHLTINIPVRHAPESSSNVQSAAFLNSDSHLTINIRHDRRAPESSSNVQPVEFFNSDRHRTTHSDNTLP